MAVLEHDPERGHLPASGLGARPYGRGLRLHPGAGAVRTATTTRSAARRMSTRTPTRVRLRPDRIGATCAHSDGRELLQLLQPSAGDAPFGGSIDWQTPYAEIQGSGDGTLDVYSFEVTPDMLNPTPIGRQRELDRRGARAVLHVDLADADRHGQGRRRLDARPARPRLLVHRDAGDTLTLAGVAAKLRRAPEARGSNPVPGYTATASGASLTIANPSASTSTATWSPAASPTSRSRPAP